MLVRVSVAHRESSGKERLSGRPSDAPPCMLCQGTGGCGPISEVPGSVSLAEALFWLVLPQRVAGASPDSNRRIRVSGGHSDPSYSYTKNMYSVIRGRLIQVPDSSLPP